MRQYIAGNISKIFSILFLCVFISSCIENSIGVVDNSDCRSAYENKILFLTNRWSNNPDIFNIAIVNEDGSDLKKVYDKKDVTKITWNLKEGQIFFVTDTSAVNNKYQIYSCGINGLSEKLLYESQYGVSSIKCSPENNLLLLLLCDSLKTKLEIFDCENKSIIAQTDWSEEIRDVCWSPKGLKIAFIAYEGIDLIIKTKDMNKDLNMSSSGLRLFHDMVPEHNFIEWSSSTDEIAVNINHFGFALSYSYNHVMGSDAPITAGNYLAEGISWSQTGEQIVLAQSLLWFVDDKYEHLRASLYIYKSDGTGMAQLTDNNYDDIEPCWQ